jgi:endo-1,4-beta-xylanase
MKFAATLCAALVLVALAARAEEPLPRLRDLAGDRFLIGMSLSDKLTNPEEPDPLGLRDIINYHANTSTCENALKWRHLQRERGPIDFTRADAFVAYCEQNGLWPVGHTLLWDLKDPAWIFEGVTRDQLIERMRTHIHTVVGRYKGRIKQWDVVNEAIDGQGRFNKSPWQRIIGPEYIELAFKFAHEADPDAQLFYNDNHMFLPKKREATLALIQRLKSKGIRIDGIGMQGHFFNIRPDFKNVEKSIIAFANAGMRVSFTEVDISVLPAAWNFVDQDINEIVEGRAELNPYTNGLPPEVEAVHTESYVKLFRLFVKHADKIDRVTFWCVSDADSWLNYRPVVGRTDYPLLFDRQQKPKRVFFEVVKVLRGE